MAFLQIDYGKRDLRDFGVQCKRTTGTTGRAGLYLRRVRQARSVNARYEWSFTLIILCVDVRPMRQQFELLLSED